MHNIFAILLLFITLFSLRTEAYAQAACTPNPVCPPQFTLNSNNKCVSSGGGRTSSQDATLQITEKSCPSGTCADSTNTTACKCIPNTDPSKCADIASTNPNPAAKTTPQCTSPDDPNCTGGRGITCNSADGSIPGASEKGDGIMTAIGCIPTEPRLLISGLLRYSTFAAGGIAFLLMLLGALQMITAEGNPESIKHAQERFYSAIIGLLLIIFSVLLMQVIGVDILGLKGFER